MFNHYVLCSNDWTHKDTIFFYNSYIINDLKSKGLAFDMVHRKGIMTVLLLENLSRFFPLPKKSSVILPLKGLNPMKYVMKQNTSLNATRNILNILSQYTKILSHHHWKQESCWLLPNKNMPLSPSDRIKSRESEEWCCCPNHRYRRKHFPYSRSIL